LRFPLSASQSARSRRWSARCRIAFRNVVLHHDFGVDLDLVWAIITEHIGPLASSLDSILKSLPE